METNDYLYQLFNSREDKPIVSVENNRYVNNLFQIEFDIPEDWHILSLKRFRDESSKQTFNEPFEQFKQDALEFFDSSSLVLTKYDADSEEYDGIISPTLNFSIIPKENDYDGMSLLEYADLLSDAMVDQPILKEFEITHKGTIFRRGNYDFIIYHSSYLFEHPELEEGITVEMVVLNVDYDDFFLDFSMTDCKAQGNDEQDIFAKFIDSIQLGR